MPLCGAVMICPGSRVGRARDDVPPRRIPKPTRPAGAGGRAIWEVFVWLRSFDDVSDSGRGECGTNAGKYRAPCRVTGSEGRVAASVCPRSLSRPGDGEATAPGSPTCFSASTMIQPSAPADRDRAFEPWLRCPGVDGRPAVLPSVGSLVNPMRRTCNPPVDIEDGRVRPRPATMARGARGRGVASDRPNRHLDDAIVEAGIVMLAARGACGTSLAGI
jgi:hypothetical protein